MGQGAQQEGGEEQQQRNPSSTSPLGGLLSRPHLALDNHLPLRQRLSRPAQQRVRVALASGVDGQL